MSLQLLLKLNELRSDATKPEKLWSPLKSYLCLNADKKSNYRSWLNAQEDITFGKAKAIC